MLAQLDERLETLRREAQQAEEEAAKIRPRLQYLQEMLLRLEGAIVALTQLKEALPTASPPLSAIPEGNSAYLPVAP